MLLSTTLAPTGIVAAQPSAGPEPESVSFHSLGFKGLLQFKNFSHFQTTPNDDSLFRDEGILDLEWSQRPVPWADFKLVLEARGDDDDFTDGVRPASSSRQTARKTRTRG